METILLTIAIMCGNVERVGPSVERNVNRLRCVKDLTTCVMLDKAASPHVKFANCLGATDAK
jgi:hypothetical protein